MRCRSRSRAVIADVDAELLLVSYNDESWLSADDLVAMCRRRLDQRAGPQDDATVAILGLDQPRYVGARIGIHNPAGEKVGTVSHLRNTELIAWQLARARLSGARFRAGLLAAAGSGLEAEEMPV